MLNYNCEACQEALNKITFVVLGTVVLTFDKKNIVCSRILQSRGLGRGGGGGGGGSEIGGDSVSRLRALPSCIVKHTSPSVVRDVIRAKRTLKNNYLTTSNILPELLGPETASYVLNHKIFINEKLPQDKFLTFKSLRPIAQALGIKYVWHAGGRFLTRHKDGEYVHALASAADLQAIQTANQAARRTRL